MKLRLSCGVRRRNAEIRYAVGGWRGGQSQDAGRDVRRRDRVDIRERVRIDRQGHFTCRIRHNVGEFERVDNVVTIDDITKNVIVIVERFSGVKRNVKLSVARAGTAVGICDRSAATVRQNVGIFVRNLKTGAARSRAGRRAALKHKAGHDTMDLESFIVIRRNQIKEMSRRIRRLAFGGKQLQDNVAYR